MGDVRSSPKPEKLRQAWLRQPRRCNSICMGMLGRFLDRDVLILGQSSTTCMTGKRMQQGGCRGAKQTQPRQ